MSDVHTEPLSPENVDLGFFLLKPDTPVKPEKIFNRQISDATIDVKAAYIVADVTSNGNWELARNKLYQMETDLAFLLAHFRLSYRKRIK
jgi:hypothetical protein